MFGKLILIVYTLIGFYGCGSSSGHDGDKNSPENIVDENNKTDDGLSGQEEGNEVNGSLPEPSESVSRERPPSPPGDDFFQDIQVRSVTD